MKAFTIWTARHHLPPLGVFNCMYYQRVWTLNNPAYTFTSVMNGNTRLAMFDSLGGIGIDQMKVPYKIIQEKGNKT